eukprot:2903721-Pleurochrysis_carterae.AAC.7
MPEPPSDALSPYPHWRGDAFDAPCDFPISARRRVRKPKHPSRRYASKQGVPTVLCAERHVPLSRHAPKAMPSAKSLPRQPRHLPPAQHWQPDVEWRACRTAIRKPQPRCETDPYDMPPAGCVSKDEQEADQPAPTAGKGEEKARVGAVASEVVGHGRHGGDAARDESAAVESGVWPTPNIAAMPRRLAFPHCRPDAPTLRDAAGAPSVATTTSACRTGADCSCKVQPDACTHAMCGVSTDGSRAKAGQGAGTGGGGGKAGQEKQCVSVEGGGSGNRLSRGNVVPTTARVQPAALLALDLNLGDDLGDVGDFHLVTDEPRVNLAKTKYASATVRNASTPQPRARSAPLRSARCADQSRKNSHLRQKPAAAVQAQQQNHRGMPMNTRGQTVVRRKGAEPKSDSGPSASASEGSDSERSSPNRMAQEESILDYVERFLQGPIGAYFASQAQIERYKSTTGMADE